MTTVTDSFTRADETPLAGNWTTGTSDAAFNLASNIIVPSSTSSDCASYYSGATWGNDQSSAGKLTVNQTGGGGQGIGLTVRQASGARTHYRLIGDHSASNNFEIGKRVASTFTPLRTFTEAFSDGDLFEFRIIGTTITVYHLGVLVNIGATLTDSSIASGFPGVAHSSNTFSASIDDWTGTDVFDVSPAVPRAFNAIPFMGGVL